MVRKRPFATIYHSYRMRIAMDLCDHLHIFKKFYQGNTKFFLRHEGTGLGVLSGSEFTRILGGKVSFKSHKGAGIEFSVTEVCKSAKKKCR